MGAKGKMRGALRGMGHCRVSGHGQSCSLTNEIRDDGMDRAREKRVWRDEAESEAVPPLEPQGEDDSR